MDNITLFLSDDENENEVGEKKINKINDNYISEIPWVEKYRPETLDGIVGHIEIITILRNAVLTGKLQHLLLYGPPGTGKTSIINAVANELFGPNLIKDRILELNASDDKGIGTVRNKIISFAKIAIGTKDPNYPCPNFKIIILDEADTMTEEAQSALRKVIENMSKITIFCFICNYVNRIIEPIASRCMKLKFKLIQKDDLLEKLKYISEKEKLEINDDCLNAIIELSEGDARRSIMSLQNMQYLIKYNKNITRNEIIQMNGNINIDMFKNFWEICSKGSFKEVYDLTSELCRNGFIIKSILKLLMECVLNSNNNDKIKSTLLIEICNTDKRVSEGCTEYIQLLNILLLINNIIKQQ